MLTDPSSDSGTELSVQSSHSFHDRLLIRSNQHKISKRRGFLASLQDRKNWLTWGTGLAWAATDCVVFLGGVGLGAGVVFFRRDDSFGNRSKVLILAASLGFVVVTMMARLAWKIRSSSTATQQPAVRA